MQGRCRLAAAAEPVYDMTGTESTPSWPEGAEDRQGRSEGSQLRIVALSIAGGLAVLVGPALADAGVPPVWTDFQPAVSTQYRPPDGGRRYPPPHTNTLNRPTDQRAAEQAEVEL